MPNFNVSLSAVADVAGHVQVDAPTQKEAGPIAVKIASEGDVIWRYDGIRDDFDIRVNSIVGDSPHDTTSR